MGKLIRDLIPQLFPDMATRTLQRKELRAALLRKLVEEAVEAARADDEELLEELPDVLEVVTAILATSQHSWPDLEAEAAKKAKRRGGFVAGLYAEEFDDGLGLDLFDAPVTPARAGPGGRI